MALARRLIQQILRNAFPHLEPLLDVVEWFLVCDVVDHDDAVGASVVGRGDGPEPLLPRGVPDLNSVKMRSLTFHTKRGVADKPEA